MTEFHKIHSKMWRDSWFVELSTAGKLLWIYIKTTSTSYTMRVYNVPSRLVSIETGIDEATVNELLLRFSNEEKIPTREQYATSISGKHRYGHNYIAWRNAVLERDNYTCRKCGKKDSLVAHHINQWALHEKLRFDISNGLTLCHDCHKLEKIIRKQ